MREQPIFTATLALLAAAASLFLSNSFVLDAQTLVVVLLLACLLAGKLLLQLFAVRRGFVWFASAVCFGLAFFVMQAYALPLAAVLIVELYFEDARNKHSAIVPVVMSAACIALLCVVLQPDPVCLLLILLITCPHVWFLLLMRRLNSTQQSRDALRQQVERGERRLDEQRQMIQAVQRDAQLEERSRLASKIHDKLGHGVTGSILSLEAALVLWDKDAAKARQNVLQVTDNLRESIDGIRTDLRTERSQNDQAGLARLARALETFEHTHGITTSLEINGSLDMVAPAVWVCLYLNLMETLTNVLKHSGASEFRVIIVLKDQLLRVEFADNGVGDASRHNRGGMGSRDDRGGGRSMSGKGNRSEHNSVVTLGIGLETIAERCLLCGGHATFNSTPGGFSVLMTFTQRGIV
jgi:signal transduction histidine kinase